MKSIKSGVKKVVTGVGKVGKAVVANLTGSNLKKIINDPRYPKKK